MKVTIDGQETACVLTPEMTYDAALDAVKQAVGEGRVITSLSLDGVAMDVTNEKEFVAKKVKDIGTLAVTTDTPGAFAKRSVEGMIGFFTSFEKNVDDMIAFLQSGGEEDVYDAFSDGLGCLRDVFSFMDIAAGITKTDLKTLTVGTKKADMFLHDCAASFDELKTALKDRDIVYIQDILRYELKPNLRTVKEILAEFGKRLG
jgi:hypothetical protein